MSMWFKSMFMFRIYLAGLGVLLAITPSEKVALDQAMLALAILLEQVNHRTPNGNCREVTGRACSQSC